MIPLLQFPAGEDAIFKVEKGTNLQWRGGGKVDFGAKSSGAKAGAIDGSGAKEVTLFGSGAMAPKWRQSLAPLMAPAPKIGAINGSGAKAGAKAGAKDGCGAKAGANNGSGAKAGGSIGSGVKVAPWRQYRVIQASCRGNCGDLS